jgi:hypothetical protein
MSRTQASGSAARRTESDRCTRSLEQFAFCSLEGSTVRRNAQPRRSGSRGRWFLRGDTPLDLGLRREAAGSALTSCANIAASSFTSSASRFCSKGGMIPRPSRIVLRTCSSVAGAPLGSVGFCKQAVQLRWVLDQMQVLGGVVAHGAVLVVQLLAPQRRLGGPVCRWSSRGANSRSSKSPGAAPSQLLCAPVPSTSDYPSRPWLWHGW